MPRPTKAFRRLKINAAIAYKRGERAEAYKLWDQASKNLAEHQGKKRNKKKQAAEVAAAATAESTTA